MKISVIVPVYNASKYITKLIDSIERQTYQNYEIILVNDGSIDDSLEKITMFSKKNEKIKVFTKNNTGPGLTRKIGFEKASGDLIFFVDSDDWITSDNVFERIVDIFSNNNIDILFFDREDIVDDKVNSIKGFKKLKQGRHDISEINEKIIPGLGEKIFKSNMLSEEMFINVNISSILASIISINSELLITLFLASSTVFSTISLSLSIYDFIANPYCLFSFSASSSEIFNTI